MKAEKSKRLLSVEEYQHWLSEDMNVRGLRIGTFPLTGIGMAK
jgi:hypothetical protein